MLVIVVQAIGVLVVLIGSIWLAGRVRRAGRLSAVENASRVSHGLFWVGLILPGMVGLIHPGLADYDELLGLPGLPDHPPGTIAGVVLLASGLLLMAGSNRFLMKRGRGAAAFLLTQRLVTDGLYRRTRNPMSLGFYAAGAGLGLIAGSLTVTVGVVLIIVPVHVFNLKFLEERELARRYGESYAAYKREVPFLIPRLRRR